MFNCDLMNERNEKKIEQENDLSDESKELNGLDNKELKLFHLPPIQKKIN